MNDNIKCPYCESNKPIYLETVFEDVGVDAGQVIHLFGCVDKNCHEEFYVEYSLNTVEVKCRKGKWN